MKNFLLLMTLLAFVAGCSEVEEEARYLAFMTPPPAQNNSSDDYGRPALGLCDFSESYADVFIVKFNSEAKSHSQCLTDPPSLYDYEMTVEAEIVTVIRGGENSGRTINLQIPQGGIPAPKIGTYALAEVYQYEPKHNGVLRLLTVELFSDAVQAAARTPEDAAVNLPSSISELRTELNSATDHCAAEGEGRAPASEQNSSARFVDLEPNCDGRVSIDPATGELR